MIICLLVTTDLILFDKDTQTVIVADYKTNSEDLFKNYKGKTMMTPFTDMFDSPYNHYQVQLSLYQMMFEQTGYTVSDRWLIHLQEDGNYKLFRTYNFTNRLKGYYEWIKLGNDVEQGDYSEGTICLQ